MTDTFILNSTATDRIPMIYEKMCKVGTREATKIKIVTALIKHFKGVFSSVCPAITNIPQSTCLTQPIFLSVLEVGSPRSRH